MKKQDAALLLWVVYKLFSTGFMCMFLAGLLLGAFKIAGSDPLFQYMDPNYLMIGGTGGMIMMNRADGKKLLKASGVFHHV